jgi:hypothetical protein
VYFAVSKLSGDIVASPQMAQLWTQLNRAAQAQVVKWVLPLVTLVFLGVGYSVLPADAAAVLFGTLVRFIKDGLRLLLVVGLIVAASAFLTGLSVTAVRIRGAAASGLGWLRARGVRAGLRTGPVGRWTYTHRKGLRVNVIAAEVFVFWGQPTVAVALVPTHVLLAALGVIELVGRPPARPVTAGPPGDS